MQERYSRCKYRKVPTPLPVIQKSLIIGTQSVQRATRLSCWISDIVSTVSNLVAILLSNPPQYTPIAVTASNKIKTGIAVFRAPTERTAQLDTKVATIIAKNVPREAVATTPIPIKTVNKTTASFSPVNSETNQRSINQFFSSKPDNSSKVDCRIFELGPLREKAQIETLYLDDSLRIVRGCSGAGSIFVFSKLRTPTTTSTTTTTTYDEEVSTSV